jgi:hypothetical protein
MLKKLLLLLIAVCSVQVYASTDAKFESGYHIFITNNSNEVWNITDIKMIHGGLKFQPSIIPPKQTIAVIATQGYFYGPSLNVAIAPQNHPELAETIHGEQNYLGGNVRSNVIPGRSVAYLRDDVPAEYNGHYYNPPYPGASFFVIN